MARQPATVEEALLRIRAWGEARDWRGYDPYDGLNSPAAPALSLGTALGRRVLTQAVKLSPLNIRPLLGIKPSWNAKGIALVASGYARLAAARGDENAAQQAARWLEWLVANHAGGTEGLAWGYHFDVQTRVFSYRRGTPNTIATTFVAQSLLEGAELLGEPSFLDAAERACAFLTSQMLVEGGSGRTYFRYVPGERELIHNANALACAVLARTGVLTTRPPLVETARAALRTTLAAQRDDGSFPYGQRHSWVDNFHTGYVLESLAACESVDSAVGEQLQRGLDFWTAQLFLADGTPKYFAHRAPPLDAHCYAQAIETWCAVAGIRSDALDHATRAATLLIERMLDPAGYVYFQQRRLWTSKVPLVRWTTAPAFRALAGLLLQRRAGERDGATLREYTHSGLDRPR